MNRYPGEVVGGRYELVRMIARGGMGAVYEARHLVSRRTVALKVTHPHVADAPGALVRFTREASVGARVGHPGIAPVLDAGVDADGSLFLAMELLHGETMRRRLARGVLRRGEALELVLAVLEPLAAAHEGGFVHRDLKPENVFLARDPASPDAPEQVKLLDFGIARDVGGASATRTGTALGTPHYMAPEQAMSSKAATPAADVWSVGVMLYEILSGEPPFDGATPHAVVVAACTRSPAPIAQVAPDVGPRLASIVDRALAKDPDDRFTDARALANALREALTSDPDSSGSMVPSRPPPPAIEADVLDDATVPTRMEIPLSTESEIALRVEAGEGWSIDVPARWTRRASALPGVVAVLVAPVTVDGVELSIRIKRDEWDGDTRSFADLGMTNMAGMGRIHRSGEIPVAGLPGVEVEVTHFGSDPPLRAIHRCVVSDGAGWVIAAHGPVARFLEVAPTLRSVLSSFRLARALDAAR